MAIRVNLRGKFEITGRSHIERRAQNTNDRRYVFYVAMLKHDTYEDYLEDVGDWEVFVPTFGAGKTPISGRMEILYVRRLGKIADIGG